MPVGNIGTIAAQRGLFKLFLDSGIDLSVSTPDHEIFRLVHPESKDMQVYGYPILTIKGRAKHSTLQPFITTLLYLILLTLMAPFIRIRVKLSTGSGLIKRLKECNVFIDLNLELFRGVPISVSTALVKQRPSVLVIHKLFWTLRIFLHMWYLLLMKSILKKRLVVGPASFGPFDNLPNITKWAIKIFLNRFVDLILVREPYSAKLLHKLGVKNYCIIADVALINKPSYSSQSISRHPRNVIGVAPAIPRYSLTKEEIEHYLDAHAKCLGEFALQGWEILFIPSTPEDLATCKAIISRMKYSQHIKLIVTYDVDKYETIIKQLGLLITTRTHPSIIAARNCIPFISIIYDHKQIGFLQQIGLRKYSLLINKVSYANLKLLIDEAIKNYEKLKETLVSTISRIQREQASKLLYYINVLSKSSTH